MIRAAFRKVSLPSILGKSVIFSSAHCRSRATGSILLVHVRWTLVRTRLSGVPRHLHPETLAKQPAPLLRALEGGFGHSDTEGGEETPTAIQRQRVRCRPGDARTDGTDTGRGDLEGQQHHLICGGLSCPGARVESNGRSDAGTRDPARLT